MSQTDVKDRCTAQVSENLTLLLNEWPSFLKVKLIFKRAPYQVHSMKKINSFLNLIYLIIN